MKENAIIQHTMNKNSSFHVSVLTTFMRNYLGCHRFHQAYVNSVCFRLLKSRLNRILNLPTALSRIHAPIITMLIMCLFKKKKCSM